VKNQQTEFIRSIVTIVTNFTAFLYSARRRLYTIVLCVGPIVVICYVRVVSSFFLGDDLSIYLASYCIMLKQASVVERSFYS